MKAALFALLALALAACDASSEPPVTTFENDDAEMNAAMQEARNGLDRFIEQLRSPKPGQTHFSLKARFDAGNGKGEHIWLSEVAYQDDAFTGKIGNVPKSFKNLSLGDAVVVPRARVSDWMFVEGGRLIGGATIRVARSRKSPADREAFDRSVPFRCD